MKKLREILYAEGLENIDRNKLYFRKTARAIIVSKNNEKLLMLYSQKYNDYTFPGGGLEKNEYYKEALQRELKEEVGLIDFEILKPYGQILEVKRSLTNDKFKYKQLNKYFVVKANRFGKNDLKPNEKKMLLKAVWITPKDAYELNLKTKKESKRNSVTLQRENMILKSIMEDLENNYEKNF